ncbi:MAG TPA: alpha/beta hydrolase [Chloroflexota bacterium]|nr:alpha/beta hydrolase [Chloroflexota bacterium]
MLSGPIEVGGLRTLCRVQGEGPPAVLLHGWGTEGASLQPLAAHLARRYRTITPDLPGFGGTALPPTDWGVNDYADWTRQLLARLGISRALFLGHSNGGRIGIVLAATCPALVERLVLVDSAGLRPRLSARQRAAAPVSKLGRAAGSLPLVGPLADRLRGRWHRALGAEDYANAGPLRGTFVKIVNRDLRELLPRIQAPTLLLWGTNDDATPLDDAETMARLIPNARLVVLPGAGHYSYLDRPAEACAAVDEFLTSSQVPS